MFDVEAFYGQSVVIMKPEYNRGTYENKETPCLVTLEELAPKYRKKPNDVKARWFGRSSWFSPRIAYTDDDERKSRGECLIVKVYGYEDELDLEETERNFQREFFKPQPQDVTDETGYYGFVSPDGKFYPCGYGGHSSKSYTLAYTLCQDSTLDKIPDTVDCLLYEGWMMITESNIQHNYDLTEQQSETLKKIVEVADAPHRLKRRGYRLLELLEN